MPKRFVVTVTDGRLFSVHISKIAKPYSRLYRSPEVARSSITSDVTSILILTLTFTLAVNLGPLP